MHDTDLYRQLLGLETPWTVTRVELSVETQQVDVWAGHSEGLRWPCPECSTALPLYDHPEERAWRHWTAASSRPTCMPVRPASGGPTRMGIDEKAAAKGHRYLTLVYDLTGATVEYVGEKRKQASRDGYFTSLTPTQREAIAAIAMDMWEPYLQSVRTYVPGAETKIVFDRFHIMGHMGTAVDTVRPPHSPPPAQRADLLYPSDYERRQRRAQRENPADQEDGLRLPQPRTLEDRDLLYQ